MRRLIGITLVAFAIFSVPAGARPAANVTLHVAVGGTAGVIHVSTATSKHSCLIACSYRYPAGTKVSVRAQAAANVTHFVAWSGGCKGTKPTCTLTLSRNTSLAGTFAIGG